MLRVCSTVPIAVRFGIATLALWAIATATASAAPEKSGRLKIAAEQTEAGSNAIAVQVRSRWKQRIAVEQRVGKRWRSLTVGRPNPQGRFAATITPVAARNPVTLRAHLRRRGLVSRSVRVQLFAPSPRAADDAAAVPEDSESVAIDVLANDGGGTGALRVAEVGTPAGGIAAIGPNGVSYRPAPGYCNSLPGGTPDRFEYAVADELGNTARATITVRVTCLDETADPQAGGLAVGFNNNAVLDRVAAPGETADLLAAVGADIDRVQMSWKQLEPSPGQYRFSTYDAIYQADLARGVRPLFIFAFAPAWASGGVCAGALTSCHAPPTRDHYDDAARTAAVIAARYPEAAGIEIWNEPNTPYFWRPAPDPIAYTSLLRAAHDAVKAVDPSMPVAGGSTASGVSGSPGKIRASHFLAAMYAAGAAEEMDAISMHAYPDPGAEAAVSTVDEVRRVRDLLGNPRTPIWVTEAGATTTGPDAVSEAAQAAVLADIDRRLRSTPDVEMLLFHTLVEPPRGITNEETGFGLVAASLRKKPGYCVLGQAWGRPSSC